MKLGGMVVDGYNITWILHKIFMFSNKVNLQPAAG